MLLLQQQDGSRRQRVKPVLAPVALCSQAQSLSVHSPLEFSLPRVLFVDVLCTPLWPGIGALSLGMWESWFVASALGSSLEALGHLLVLFTAQLVMVAPLPCFIQQSSTSLGRTGSTPSFASLCWPSSGCTLGAMSHLSLCPVLVPREGPRPVSEIQVCAGAGHWPGF